MPTHLRRIALLLPVALLCVVPGCTREAAVAGTVPAPRTAQIAKDKVAREHQPMTQSSSVDPQVSAPVDAAPTTDRRPPIDRKAPARATLQTATFALG